MVQNIQFVMVINIINKDIFVKKHEAKQWCACTIIVACRLAKCDVNEVNAQCGKSFSKDDNRVKHDNLERILALLLYANGMSLRSTQRVLESYFNVKIPFKLILDWIANMSKQLQLDIDKNNKKQKPKTIEILELDEAQRQGDESLLSITNEWLKAWVFAKVPTEFTK